MSQRSSVLSNIMFSLILKWFSRSPENEFRNVNQESSDVTPGKNLNI